MMKHKLTNQNLDLKESICKRITNPFYLIAVSLTALGAYGFYLANPSPSIDWLSYDRYYSGILFGQGRFTATIVERVLNLWDCPVWFEPLLGLVCFILGTLIMLAIFDGFTEYRSIVPSIVFSCIYISFPLLAEYFIYNGAILTVGGCTVLLSLALYFSIKYSDIWRCFILPTVLMMFVFSWYECMILPYIGMVFALLIFHTSNENKVKLHTIFSNGFPFALVLFSSSVFEFIFTKILIKLFSISVNHNANFGINWYISILAFRNLFFSYIRNWVAMCFGNIAFTVLAVFFIVFLVIIIFDTLKHKSFARFLLFIGILIPLFFMTLLRCGGKEYRTEQGMPFFVAFVFYFIAQTIKVKKQTLKRIFAASFVFILILQIGGSNRAYWINNQRYEEEKNLILNINGLLTHEHDIQKPVVFIGNIRLSDNFNRKIVAGKNTITEKIAQKFSYDGNDELEIHLYDYLGFSYINWSINYPLDPQNPNSELYKFCDYIGVSYKHCTKDQFEDAQKRYADLPSYPNKGFIVENDEYIVVKIGEVIKTNDEA